MLELGQPLHAFDDRLLDGAIVVRFARRGRDADAAERPGARRSSRICCSSADEREAARPRRHHGRRALGHRRRHDATCSSKARSGPAAIAGQDRAARLRDRRRLSLRARRRLRATTSTRIERATQLILEICGGRAGPLDRRDAARCRARRRCALRARARRAAARHRAVADDAIADVFTRLRLAVRRATATTSSSRRRRYRFDLAIEEDLIEEVARIHGYDAIPADAARRTCRRCCPRPKRGARAFDAARACSPRATGRKSITFSFVASATSARSIRRRERRSRC